MKKNLIKILLLILSSSILGCNNHASNKEFKQKVEANIKLDSTVLSVSVVAEKLDVPWEITWGPDDYIWFTEQSGIISRINPVTGEKQQLLKIEEVYKKGTTGLLGMVLHPDMKHNPYVFIDYTVKKGKKIFSKLVRYTYHADTLINPKIFLTIPGSRGHNGSRLAISPRGKLIWATGDGQKKSNPQNNESLNGKILRLNLDGSVPDNNTVKGSYVWAKGFRNMQGLVFSKRGYLYTSEHGDALEDEVNLIVKGGNYGWPQIEGVHDLEEEKVFASANKAIEPLLSWTPTIAPAGLTFYGNKAIPEWENSLLLTTLKARSLRVLKLNDEGTQIKSETIYLEDYGRLRSVCVSPAGDVYVSTSNKDWNPFSQPDKKDDRILRISKVSRITSNKVLAGKKASENNVVENVEQLYNIYCGSCHKADGSGVAGTFPALAGSAKVNGSKETLIGIFLKGIKNPSKGEQMPAFRFLNDEEGAAILTYIRTNWGNKSGAVNPEEIKTLR